MNDDGEPNAAALTALTRVGSDALVASNGEHLAEGLIDFREERLDAWCSFFARATLSAAGHSARLAEELTALREAWRERVGRHRVLFVSFVFFVVNVLSEVSK